MKKVLFLVRSLNIGGAERQLYTLLRTIDRSRFNPVIVIFYSEGTMVSEFNTSEIPVLSAAKASRWDVIPFVFRLIRIIRNEKPDMVVSYLVAANILAILLKPFFKPARIVISIRHSVLRKEDYDWLSSLLYSIENRIAGWSDLIVVNSFFGAIQAQERGIPEEKMVVIPNGIDTIKFHPDLDLRETQRRDLKIQEESILIGLVGRLDPAKNHIGFIEAASIIKYLAPQAKFMIIGDGPDDYRQNLIRKISENQLDEKVNLVPAQLDPVPIYNALDICISNSVGEGFSNVIAEAMACEIPCVVTDVGDSARIIGQTGMVTPANNAQKLADAMLFLINMGSDKRKEMGRNARERVIAEFSVKKMVASTMEEFERLG